MSNTTVLSGNEDIRSFMDKLVTSNASQYVDLPMIAVMGDTSSGKSSLLTSISMVELPSSEKLTTRCPIMLQMKRAEKRTAKVTVDWKNKKRAHVQNVFGPKEVDDSNWHELTGHIADAQSFIIAKTGNQDVAQDVVRVQVFGPLCEDLTLIDLPGIVRATGAGESETLAADIQCLIDDYLANSRCVILAVHPANVDFHNSQIMADAKKVDPETKRTLPVITKPDLIDDGAEEGVKELLLGMKTDKFEKGFHMVKGRGQASLNKKQSVEEGLKDEETFFRNTQPWRDVEARSLFGTKELRIKLGELQMQLIRDTLPSIISEIKDLKHDADEGLRVMGASCETTMEKRLFYTEVTRSIMKRLTSHLLGKDLSMHTRKRKIADAKAASAVFHEKCEEFRQVLHRGRLASITSIRRGDDIIARHEDKEFSGTVVELDKSGNFLYLDVDDVSPGEECIFSSGPQRGGTKAAGTVWRKGRDVYIAKENGYYHCLKKFPAEKVRRDPDWLRVMIKENRPYELPVFINVSVFNYIVETFIVDDWLEPCMDFVASVADLLMKSYERAIEEEVRLRRYPRLAAHMTKTFRQGLDQLMARAKEKVENYVEREKLPYTQNDYLSEELSKRRSKYVEEGIFEALGLDDGQPNAMMSKSSVKTTIEAVFRRNRDKAIDYHMATDMEDVLQAYGKIAEKRFIDEVPMICGKLLHEFPTHMENMLLVVTGEELNMLVSDSREFQIKYANLRQQSEDMGEALVLLDTLY